MDAAAEMPPAAQPTLSYRNDPYDFASENSDLKQALDIQKFRMLESEQEKEKILRRVQELEKANREEENELVMRRDEEQQNDQKWKAAMQNFGHQWTRQKAELEAMRQRVGALKKQERDVADEAAKEVAWAKTVAEEAGKEVMWAKSAQRQAAKAAIDMRKSLAQVKETLMVKE